MDKKNIGLFYVLSIVMFASGRSMGPMWLCLGSSFLCLGTVLSRRAKEGADEKK